MPIPRQAGFTLVELMVALLIGSIVVLGAGSLFLTTLQTFQKVDELSRKQEAVIFSAHTLSAGLRLDKEHYELMCEVIPKGQCECTLQDTTEDPKQPLVTFKRPLESDNPSKKDCKLDNPPDFRQSNEVIHIPLPLEKDGEALKFQVTRRQPVLDAL